MRPAALLLVLCAGCGAVDAASTHATESAVNVLDDPAYTKKIDDAAHQAGSAFAAGALDPVLSGDTEKRAREEETTLLRTATAELVRARAALLDPAAVRPPVRAALDEALGPKTQAQVAELRETLVGAPLRKDLDDAADEASTRLSAKITTAKADVAADVTQYRWALWALGGVVLLLALLHAHAVHELRRARAR